jgi:molybdopterin synthase catalytic subunit
MIIIQEDDIAFEPYIERLRSETTGATVMFIGSVKTPVEGVDIEALELEAYKEMAQRQLESLEARAREKYQLEDVVVIHRIGTLKVKETIVLVAVSAYDRERAFAGARYILEKLKAEVPIFKKEHAKDSTYWHGDR